LDNGECGFHFLLLVGFNKNLKTDNKMFWVVELMTKAQKPIKLRVGTAIPCQVKVLTTIGLT
jgi:hypothetical protein